MHLCLKQTLGSNEVLLMWDVTDLAAVRDMVADTYVYTAAIYDELMRARAQSHLALLFCATLLFSSLCFVTCRRPPHMAPTVVVAEPLDDKEVKV